MNMTTIKTTYVRHMETTVWVRNSNDEEVSLGLSPIESIDPELHEAEIGEELTIELPEWLVEAAGLDDLIE